MGAIKKNSQLLLLLFALFILNSCGLVDDMLVGTEGHLVYEKKQTLPESNVEVPYLNYDDVFLKENDEPKTVGRHASATPDGKIDWTKPDEQKFYVNPKEMKIDELVSIDNKPIQLPCKFNDLGEEFAIFDKIDFSLMTHNSMFPLTIKDKKTGHCLTAYSNYGEKTIIFNILDKDCFINVDVEVNITNGEIIHLLSSTLMAGIPKKNLSIKGIQIGSTLNEVYDKLGLPWTYKHSALGSEATYYFKDSEEEYMILFLCGGKLLDGKDYRRTKSENVVTRIEVFLLEEE